jgi:hypothetical protein
VNFLLFSVVVVLAWIKMARKKSAEELEDEEGGASMDYGEEPDFSDPEDFVDNITDEVSSP